ncbi:MAG: DNA-packaging protein [Janthinobacterium lividum]
MPDDTRSIIQQLAHLPPPSLAAFCAGLPPTALRRLLTDENMTAHAGQLPPAGDWTTWLILAGRGFGKTRAGASWVNRRAAQGRGVHIAVVGATMADARAVMVEGDAGVLARAGLPPPDFAPSRRLLTWPNGSTASLFSAAEPDSLRGPAFHFAWGDEAAKWHDGPAALSNLRLALRLGDRPRLLLTTTPRPLPWLKAMLGADGRGAPGIAVTRGRMADNAANLPGSFVAAMQRDYGGSRLGRQELDGEIVDDLEGALWRREMFEAHRVRLVPTLVRTVVGVDPPASTGDRADACGIVVVALGSDGRGYVLADRSVHGQSPDNWARAVAATADAFTADRVVAEVNNGGDMVSSVLRAVAPTLPVLPVRASVGKVARAEPVAALYAIGRVSHVGALPALEDELCGLMTGGSYAGPGRSPDRADALVWALSELMLGKVATLPGIRSL